MGNEKLEQIQRSAFGATAQDNAKLEAKNWAERNDGRLQEKSVLMQMLKYPYHAFNDYRFERMNKQSPDVLSESQRLKRAMESVYQDGAISPEEAKMQDVMRWKALMRGEGF